MKTTELAAEVVASKSGEKERLDELERKVTEVCTELAKTVGSSFDDIFGELIRRAQRRAALRGQVRVEVEREVLDAQASAIATETERRLAELALKA